jgi:hypothetical protein
MGTRDVDDTALHTSCRIILHPVAAASRGRIDHAALVARGRNHVVGDVRAARAARIDDETPLLLTLYIAAHGGYGAGVACALEAHSELTV